MNSEQDSYYELSYYTLSHPDPAFIHQYIVDAYAAQNADENTKPITLAFALAGLYLYLEKNYSGKKVQEMHSKMAKTKKDWPKFSLPRERGDIRAIDVLKAPAGSVRDQSIKDWCISVWKAYEPARAQIIDLVEKELAIK